MISGQVAQIESPGSTSHEETRLESQLQTPFAGFTLRRHRRCCPHFPKNLHHHHKKPTRRLSEAAAQFQGQLTLEQLGAVLKVRALHHLLPSCPSIVFVIVLTVCVLEHPRGVQKKRQ